MFKKAFFAHFICLKNVKKNPKPKELNDAIRKAVWKR